MPPKKAILEESILNFIRGTGSTNGIKNEANFEDILNSIKYETLDTNNDGKIDIVVGNKKGVFAFIQN